MPQKTAPRQTVIFAVGCALAATIYGVLGVPVVPSVSAQSGGTVRAPMFEVDPLWPKPLPNHWVLGSTIGVSVDAQDHIWILHRPGSVEDNFKAAALTPPLGRCCR